MNMISTFTFFLPLLLLITAGFARAPAAVKSASAQTKMTLRVQADLYYGDEDEEKEPVEADFYLLDARLIDILKKAKFKPTYSDGKKHRAKEADYLEAAAKILLSRELWSPPDDETELLAILIDQAIEPHRASSIRTNRFGRGYFKAVKTGNYYLFGIKQIEDQVVVWHLPVTIKSGSNSIELDQNNAATVFSPDG